MPHLSEGDLHAWLDGAVPEDSPEGEATRRHIESCPECAARLEEARQSAADADAILSGAAPRVSRPPFYDVQRRAAATEPGTSAGNAGAARRRGRWFSAERLGWAATVALALGAGWIGRAVLVEKGWTDPFHEGPRAVVTVMPEAEADGEAKQESEFLARDQDALLEKADLAGGRADGPAETNEAGVGREAAAPADDNRLKEIDSVGKQAAAETPADPQTVTPARARTDAAQNAEPQVAEELAADDEFAAAPDDMARQEGRTKSVRPSVDPWHEVPEDRLAAPSAAPGCYRLEFSWAPEVAYLPGTLELRPVEPEARLGQSVYTVVALGETGSQLHEAIWASPHADSIWVRIVSGEERDAFTVRAGLVGRDWVGEGRVLKPGGPVTLGQSRGGVRLAATRCGPR